MFLRVAAILLFLFLPGIPQTLFAAAMEDACYLTGMLANGSLQTWDLSGEEQQKIKYMKYRSASANACCRDAGESLGDVQQSTFETAIRDRNCFEEQVPYSTETQVIHVIAGDFVKITNGNRFKLAALRLTGDGIQAHEWLKENLEGKPVFLISHSVEGRRYMHAQLFLTEDGTYLNEQLIRLGFAEYDPATSVPATEDLKDLPPLQPAE